MKRNFVLQSVPDARRKSRAADEAAIRKPVVNNPKKNILTL